MAKSPVVIPFSTDGVEIALKDGVTLPTDARGFISVGLDGTTARFVVVDSSGRQVFVGAGVAGTPAGGVVSVQGVAGGTAIPISAASLPLPTGAATETTLASRLADATFTARINTLGQKTMVNSTPVVLSSDQSAIPISQADVVASGTIAANNVSITTTDQGGVGSFSIQITGTWVGTIQFEASVDGTNYVNINARTVNSGTVGVSTTTNGVFRVARPGYQFFRCRSSVWTSGTATVTIRQAANGSATVLTEALPTGANVIGAVTGSGNFNVVGPGAAGAAISGNPVRIGLSDGTNTRNLLGDASGRVIVVGAAADGAAVAGNPVLMAGQDGTNAQSILTDATGRQVVVGAAADGAAVTGNPVLIAGQDGTNAQSILTDTSGRPRVVGAAADGAAIAGDPVLIAGQDGTNVQSIRTLTDGTVQVRYKELATFTALATATVVGNNKSMLSIVNASGSAVQVRIQAIYVVNVQTSAVTGVTGTFEIRRCVNHSAGTAITAIEKMDSTDALNGSVTVRTNGTIATESANLLWRALFSTDEWGPGTQDVESGDHVFQTMFPIWKRRDMDAKPILLRANEGLTVKFATNSTAGSFDILVIFTQE